MQFLDCQLSSHTINSIFQVLKANQTLETLIIGEKVSITSQHLETLGTSLKQNFCLRTLILHAKTIEHTNLSALVQALEVNRTLCELISKSFSSFKSFFLKHFYTLQLIVLIIQKIFQNYIK